jgi:ribonuclease J
VRSRRIFDDELARRASAVVILAGTSSLGVHEDVGGLLDTDAVWSMWSGYLTSSSSAPTLRILRRNGVALHIAHASGHACPRDLQRLVAALRPERVVPVHTEFPHAMAELVGGAEPHRDQEWWEV